jgi:predicted secreted protein
MATAALAGYKALLRFSTSTGGALAKVVELRDYTLSPEHAEIDATSHDSSGDREVIAGTGSWGGTAEALFVISSGAVGSANAAFDLLTARTKIDAEFIPTGSSSDGYYDGQMFFTSWELSAPNDDALAQSLAFVGTGALVRQSSSS